MVDWHEIGDRHVETVEDQRLCQVPGQVGVPDDFGDVARPVALVCDGKLICDADGEGRDQVEVKGGGVVVVGEDDDVGVGIVDPLARPLVPLEERPPVGRVLFAVVDGGADRRHVGGGDTVENLSHWGFVRRRSSSG